MDREPLRSPHPSSRSTSPSSSRQPSLSSFRPLRPVLRGAHVLGTLGRAVLRRSRTYPRARDGTPTCELNGAPRPYARAVGLISVVLLGAWLGLLIVGSVRTPVGPMDTRMTLRPSFTGGTKINVSPLGSLELQSHTGPIRLDVDVDQLDPDRSAALVDHPERIAGLQDEVSHDVAAGTLDLALRSCVAVVSGSCALGLAVYRRPRPALAAGGLALTLLAASGGLAYATWNPKSVLEPKFSGLLASAPSVVGNARSIVSDFDVYQQELARLVTNVTKLYDVTSTLPAYQPDPATVRVLHVSDIHLNPASWHIIESLVEQYEIDVIVDTGDTMDHGTAAENGFLDPVSRLGAPYVWVRGNHDSAATQKSMESRKNVHVLNHGKTVQVAGVRLAGIGDPQFTPDRSVVAAGDPAEVRVGRELAGALRVQTAVGQPVDIALAHNPVAAEQTDGTVPLALAGHLHRRTNQLLDEGTRLMTQGSTGGSGLRAVEGDEPDPVEASVLYLDRDSHTLQAWDEITLGGLGLSTAEVSRRLPESNSPDATPAPSDSATTQGRAPRVTPPPTDGKPFWR
ncbi:metallophosphoesterase [Streptomyces sp. NPDC051776]|uniref:metallophosphoesterase family protein n=1 Tax=Streptomyces sp. NPDC051776 TaxID=3155414 RepID=UPI0034170D18